MDSITLYLFAADVTLALHILTVVFVVLGLVLVFVGKFRQWRWIYNPWFRGLHLLAIAVVVMQAWAGVICPLTTLEMWFREQGGGAVYAGSFITHWMQSLLYYQAPAWVFTTVYTVFGGAVLLSWLIVRPIRSVS